jgi:hypothetical protein
VCDNCPFPAAGGLPPPFIGQGEAIYNRVTQFHLRVAVWRTTLHSRRPSWRILLLAERHDVSCIRPGAASRVAVWEPLLWSSCVRQLKGRADRRPAVTQQWVWRHLLVPDSHSVEDGAVVPVLTVYFGTPSMFITLWFGFDYGTNPPLGMLII